MLIEAIRIQQGIETGRLRPKRVQVRNCKFKYSEEQIASIKLGRELGYNRTVIARLLGLDYKTVCRYSKAVCET